MELLSSFMGWWNTNAGGITAITGVIVGLGAFFGWLLAMRKRPKPVQLLGLGGQGGNASVGGSGIAIGGRGGRGGLSGSGGNGGSGHVDGDGMAIGGDGGDGGVPWRPALGAPSVMERQLGTEHGFWSVQDRDQFGFFFVGRGGHGGDIDAVVEIDGYRYPLLPLLDLLRVWKPALIDEADATRPENSQQFWKAVSRLDPTVAKAAQDHIRHCLDVTIPRGLPAPDPYAKAGTIGGKI